MQGQSAEEAMSLEGIIPQHPADRCFQQLLFSSMILFFPPQGRKDDTSPSTHLRCHPCANPFIHHSHFYLCHYLKPAGDIKKQSLCNLLRVGITERGRKERMEERHKEKTGPLIQSRLPANTCLCDVFIVLITPALQQICPDLVKL